MRGDDKNSGKRWTELRKRIQWGKIITKQFLSVRRVH